jgi:hypothetical protein
LNRLVIKNQLPKNLPPNYDDFQQNTRLAT